MSFGELFKKAVTRDRRPPWRARSDEDVIREIMDRDDYEYVLMARSRHGRFLQGLNGSTSGAFSLMVVLADEFCRRSNMPRQDFIKHLQGAWDHSDQEIQKMEAQDVL